MIEHLKRLKVKKTELGYSMTTRKGRQSVWYLRRKFGDVIFDAGLDRGQGSGRNG